MLTKQRYETITNTLAPLMVLGEGEFIRTLHINIYDTTGEFRTLTSGDHKSFRDLVVDDIFIKSDRTGAPNIDTRGVTDIAIMIIAVSNGAGGKTMKIRTVYGGIFHEDGVENSDIEDFTTATLAQLMKTSEVIIPDEDLD